MVIKEFPLVPRFKVTLYTRNRTSTKTCSWGQDPTVSGCIAHFSKESSLKANKLWIIRM